MIHKIILPKIEPNMEEAMIVEWVKKENELVNRGEPLFLIETAKATIEVEAEESGVLRKIIVEPGKTIPILTVVGLIGDADEVLPDTSYLEVKPRVKEPIFKDDAISTPLREESVPFIEESKGGSMEGREDIPSDIRIKSSPAARRIAKENNVDLTLISGTGPEGRIIEDDIRNFTGKTAPIQSPNMNEVRVLVIGAGDGGEVAADILLQERNKDYNIIGFLDDNIKLWDRELYGKRILGAINLVERLHKDERFDALIISITSNMKIRKEVYDKLKSAGYKFINAIHSTAYVNPTAKIGEGNIIGAFVHVGYGTTLGNNNLISAHSDVEHHNKVGSHTLFGPGVMTSGRVSIGDGCSVGAGVNIEPHVSIGDNVAIASGSTIVFDVPADTVVKGEFKKKS
jgi:sugar O-acyltransferase (sialic acid O-acetyltransferase NeuD family)